MAFSKATKEDALVAAGRRCCLCKRFKGVKLEVHHIRPESAGGTNDFDNAVPLCFDCHTDVGHYNPNHPKGNRYSNEELRRHRDRLFDQIQSGHYLPSNRQEEWAYCRHLICKSFSALSEIVSDNLDLFPVTNPLLSDTIALLEMRNLVRIQGHNYRNSTVYGDSFADFQAYCSKHSCEHVSRESHCSDYPYFDTIRMPDDTEIRERVGPSDPISVYLLDVGVQPEDVCVALGYDDPCGGVFQESYQTRPVWTAFLEIRNIGTNSVTLCKLCGIMSDTERTYSEFKVKEDTPWSMRLPSVPILPNQSVLVPLGVLLGPLNGGLPSAIRSEDHEISFAHYQHIDRVDYSSIVQRIGILGKMIWPSLITAESGNVVLRQQLHQLDMSRIYAIDRYWAAGSCPFLLFRSMNGTLIYLKELFSGGITTLCHDSFTVPSGVKSVVVAELEHETTYIESVAVNGRIQSINLELCSGDVWEFSVRENDEIGLVGRYFSELSRRQDPLYHNQMICDFIAVQDRRL